jgi:dihydroxyacid dehydratase/phosphogluconate dehydratase
MLDVVRRKRGDAPVFATFAPAHVLRGGIIPDELREELNRVADIAEESRYGEIAEDLRDTLRYILQCSSNTAFQGVLQRAQQVGVITTDEHEYFERALAVNTCDSKGGICAFNGTGNSSRHVVAALGLVHPVLELLTEPASPAHINPAVDALLEICDQPKFSVAETVRRNMEMAVRIHSATGGSTNIMMHLVAVAISAGLKFDLWEYDRIRRASAVPDIFNYSLTEGRDIFALAEQCCSGQIRGMETVIYELDRLGVPVPFDAPTMTGQTWRERLSDTTHLPASGVTDNPIILDKPRRAVSGIDVLKGNWFESAVVKISGMPESQVDEFDGHVAAVLFFENEDHANESLLDIHFLEKVRDRHLFARDALLSMCRYHQQMHTRSSNGSGTATSDLEGMSTEQLFDFMVQERLLRLAVIIAGQGPKGFGMPEMFTPMQHLNANRVLRKLSVLLSDGRYSGVTYGAAVGHITPEALYGGPIIGVCDGDLLQIALRDRRIDWLRQNRFVAGEIVPHDDNSLREVLNQRSALIDERMLRLKRRAAAIVPTNRLVNVTDAGQGVVPLELLELEGELV